MKKTENTFTSYEVINALIDNEVITFDFEVDIENNEVLGVTDNSKYQLAFAHNIKTVEEHCTINDCIEDEAYRTQDIDNNYVAIRYNGGKENLLQLWGQKNKGVVVIEVRKLTCANLKLNDVKLFREWEKESKGGKEKEFCYVMHDTNEAVKFCKEFFKRFESKQKAKTSATESTDEAQKVG